MVKLCQINALVSGRKGEVEKAVGDIYKIVQKPELFSGRERTYRPLDDVNGEKLPRETQKIQYTAKGLIEQATTKWTELWDLVLTQDTANQTAKADIVVDGKIVLAKVPVTNLLFLEKQVNDLETFISKLPTPDASEDWKHDPNSGNLRSGIAETIKTKKVPTHYEKAPATKEHPAQVEFFHHDVPVGTWTTIQFSGAVQTDQKTEWLIHVKKLKDAIKVAREEANTLEVEVKKSGDSLFGYVFG